MTIDLKGLEAAFLGSAEQFRPEREMFVCMDPTGCYYVSWSEEQHLARMTEVGAKHEARYALSAAHPAGDGLEMMVYRAVQIAIDTDIISLDGEYAGAPGVRLMDYLEAKPGDAAELGVRLTKGADGKPRWHGYSDVAVDEQRTFQEKLLTPIVRAILTEPLAALSAERSRVEELEAAKIGLLQAIKHHSGSDHGLLGIRLLAQRAEAAEAQVKRLREALEKISCPSQTEGLLWWQVEARAALTKEGGNGE